MPEYVVVRAPEWRHVDEHVEVRDPRHDRWIPIDASAAKLFHGIEAGDDVSALVARLNEGKKPRARRDARVRRFLFNLSRLGYVDLPLDAPAVFAGRYERVKELGRGGIGVAYLCRDQATPGAPEVVVKRAWDFLQPASVTEAATRREVDVLARLGHPGIVRCLDTFEEDGRLHVVRSFVRGEDLAQLHRAPLRDRATERRIAREVAGIVGHIHERGMVMLDLRPANFLRVADDDSIALIDVGQCRDAPAGSLTLDRATGSPGFTPPEMGAHHLASVRGDIWGLGRLVYFLATGEIPAADASTQDILPHLKPEDATIVARLCADDPAQRPASMREAAALLDA